MSEPIEPDDWDIAPDLTHMTWNPKGKPMADKASPPSKVTQTIIPGAAYLWNGTLCLSDAEGELAYLTSDGFQIVSVVPSDTVILLYAPGDKVIPGVPSEWRAVVYKGDSDVEPS